MTTINANPVDVKVDGVVSYRGVTYACGKCNKVVSAEVDPIALKADIVNEVKSN